MMKNRYIGSALLIAAGIQMAGAEAWSLDSCINYAIEHNISVRTAVAEAATSELAVTEAKDAFLPQAQAGATQSFNFGRGLTSENTYANRNTSQTGWSVGVQLPLFQGLSAVRRLDYSRASLRAVMERCEAAKDNVELQVITGYLQVLYCGEVLDVAREQERLSGVQLERTQVLVEEGRLPELELTQARAKVAQDRLTAVTAENDRALGLLELSQLLQLPTTDGFDIEPLGAESRMLRGAQDIWESAQRRNHAVRAGELDVDAAERNIRLSQTGYLPRLSMNLGLGSSYYKLSGVANAPFHRRMRDNFNTSVGFTLSVPLFDAFATRNSVRRAEVSRTVAQLRLEDTRSSLYKAINQAYRQALSAESRHEAALVAEDATRQAMEAMDTKYEFGRANATEVEQARSEYIRARMATVQARYESLLRRRILEFYAG